MLLKVFVAVQLTVTLLSSVGLARKVVVLTWLSCLTRQVICISVLPGSLASVLFVTLYYLPFLLLQETLLICVVVMMVV